MDRFIFEGILSLALVAKLLQLHRLALGQLRQPALGL